MIDDSDPDHKKPSSKVSALPYHPDYVRLRKHILWLVIAATLFTVANVYFVLTRADALTVSLLLGVLTSYAIIWVIMGILMVTMWNESVLLLLVVPVYTILLGVVIGECRRHNASLLFASISS